jgi:predicted GIY-YIG superfamily endonuclease
MYGCSRVRNLSKIKKLANQKAIERRIELKELNKRRKELYLSRENWKNKYMTEKLRGDIFEKELSV